MTITGVDQAPVLSNGGNTVNYTQGGTAAVIDASLTTTDPDSVNLASATVSITAGFLAGDTLNFTAANGITGSYNAITGVLTLKWQFHGCALPGGARVHHLQAPPAATRPTMVPTAAARSRLWPMMER